MEEDVAENEEEEGNGFQGDAVATCEDNEGVCYDGEKER